MLTWLAELPAEEDVLALLAAAVEDGCTFAQAGLLLRAEWGFGVPEAVYIVREGLRALGTPPALAMLAAQYRR